MILEKVCIICSNFRIIMGASVIKHTWSYGYESDLWELGVIRFGTDDDVWGLDYDTEITDDVIGFLTDDDVRDLLKRIKELDD